ncbi:MAG: hypothetical protein OEV37_00855 [Candidatus Berkelbacteria bacterium]|nr:hypothetical protein [Candidatus Berkelbacteria bacterium]
MKNTNDGFHELGAGVRKTPDLDPRPQIIKDTGFEFDWDDKKVWELPIEAEDMPIDELVWHLEIPVWEQEGTDDWNLTPAQTLKNPEKEPSHFKKIIESDMQYPIDIMRNKGKWTLLDGYHRLARAHQLRHKTVKVRKISRDYIPQITTKMWKNYRAQTEKI